MEQIQQHEWEPYKKVARKCKHCGVRTRMLKFPYANYQIWWTGETKEDKNLTEEPECITRYPEQKQ